MPLRELDPLLARWRTRLYPGEPTGMPAHITLAFPFAAAEEIGAAEVRTLTDISSAVGPVSVTFDRLGTQGGALFVSADPSTAPSGLTAALADAWPGHAAGMPAARDWRPQLQIGRGADVTALYWAVKTIRHDLPLRATLERAELWNTDGPRWRMRCPLPFADASQAVLATAGRPTSGSTA